MEAIIVNERKHAVELKFDNAEIKLLKEAGLLSYNSLEIYMRLVMFDEEKNLPDEKFGLDLDQSINQE
tara:strand:+ start:157 stop:360 length:204 start_codon:yes stop_codon:yes gene_type:complete